MKHASLVLATTLALGCASARSECLRSGGQWTSAHHEPDGRCVPPPPLTEATPDQLRVSFDAPACHTAGTRLPSVERLLECAEPNEESRQYWHPRGCFAVELSGAAPCEWACVAHHGGPCGNAGSWDMLVILRSDAEKFQLVGKAAITDSDRSFTRTFRTQQTGDGILLVASTTGPMFAGRTKTEGYRMVDGQLVQLP